MGTLLESIANLLGQGVIEETLILHPKDAKLRALLYEKKAVVSEKINEQGNYCLSVRLPHNEWSKIKTSK